MTTMCAGTLAGRMRAWMSERQRLAVIVQARQQAEAEARYLAAQHKEIERASAAGQTAAQLVLGGGGRGAASGANPSAGPGSGPGAGLGVSAGAGSGAGSASSSVSAVGGGPVVGTAPSEIAARVNRVHLLSEEHRILDDRIATEQQLAAVYGRWAGQVEVEHRIVEHLMLESLAWIAVIVLIATGLARLAHRALERASTDWRRTRTLGTVLDVAMQAVALLGILLVIFGPPNQVPTILGLATAGLTVVFQDFILAFFGWFVLIGKDGIRVGDWVEINGVGGEVVEIGVFRTALLETGNWTGQGHPTGRRTSFVNKFAVSGQYFNFSTNGQWMWDEIRVNVPAGTEPIAARDEIQRVVARETSKDAGQAEEEWQRAARQNNVGQFRAAPSVDLRPAAAGVDVIVRYVTRAGERFEVRNRLYGAVVEVLREGKGAGEAVGSQEITGVKI